MTAYVALLRAVNVGGTGKLPMAALAAMCAELGFKRIQTYIASGNVIFESEAAALLVQAQLEKRLRGYAGKAVDVFVRTAAEMRSVLERNPFSDKDPKYTYAFFIHGKPPSDAAQHARGQSVELLRLGKREIFVYYPAGMGRSKLRIPAAERGTARNMNTVAKLVEMSAAS
jgi:uncharacterized protein (DUF1697 family)